MFDALREIMAADFQKAEEKGIARGMQQGMQRGMQQGMEKGVGIGELRAKKETAAELSGMGLPVEKIARAVKVSVKQVEEWLSDSLVTA